MINDKENYPIANQSDYDLFDNAFLFSFGAYLDTHVWVFANTFDEAFEEAIEWVDNNCPAALTSFTMDDYKETAKELELTWQEYWPDFDDENWCKVVEETEVDHTIIGHTTLKNGTHIASWEWNGSDAGEEEYKELLERAEKEEIEGD